ncbi:MAG: hypothetical protein ABJB76_02410 [Candidatus Nitrosocosmicus sp.]
MCLYNRKLALACGLISIPCSRRTFDRRLKTISTTDVKERISTMGQLFIAEGLVKEHSITAIDSTLLKAKGSVWHKSSMKKGVIPRSSIDTNARWWGYSHTKGWMDFWVQTTHYIYNSRFSYSTIDSSRCNYG